MTEVLHRRSGSHVEDDKVLIEEIDADGDGGGVLVVRKEREYENGADLAVGGDFLSLLHNYCFLEEMIADVLELLHLLLSALSKEEGKQVAHQLLGRTDAAAQYRHDAPRVHHDTIVKRGSDSHLSLEPSIVFST